MSHEAHHEEPKNKPQAAGKTSFWFVLILICLFVAAVNFVNIMGNDSEEGHEGAEHATEQMHSTEHAAHSEATTEESSENAAPSEEHEAAH